MAGKVRTKQLDGGSTAGHLITNASGDVTSLKHNLAAAVAPSATDDTSAGYAVGSIWVDTTGDSAYVCVDATASNAIWRLIGADNTTVGLSTGVGFPFFQQSAQYNEYQSTSYVEAATFIFPGTVSFNPSHVKIVTSHSSAASPNSDLELRTTAGLVVCTINWTNVAEAIVTETTLSNLPSTEALLHIWVRKQGTAKARLHFFQMK